MHNNDNNKLTENLQEEGVIDQEKVIILKKFICFAISALTTPLLEDMKKAQRVFAKIQKDPSAVFKYNYEDFDFYDETLIYQIEDGSFEVSKYVYSEKAKRNVERKFFELEQELTGIFGYPASDDDKFTRLVREAWQEKWQKISFCTKQNDTAITAKAMLINTFGMNLKLGTVCKKIKEFIADKKADDEVYWLDLRAGHNERSSEVYFNALSVIKCGMLRHPTRGRINSFTKSSDKLSDLTLPGFVLFFIKAEMEEKFRIYISTGYGDYFDITAWEKDSFMLTFSSTAWMYNIFYLDSFIKLNTDLVNSKNKKRADSVQSALNNLNQMPINANGTSCSKSTELDRVYELNHKVLRWVAKEIIRRRFENELNQYRSYLQSIGEVEQPHFSNDIKITISKVIEEKVKMCFYDFWEVSEKLSSFESMFNQIEYLANSRYLRKRLSEMEGKVNEEININDLNKLKSIKDEVDEFSKYISILISKTNKKE